MTDQGWPGQGNQPSGNGFPPYGAPGNQQPGDQYGNQFGQGHSGPSFEQPQYGQPQPHQFGQPSYGQASYGQTPGGWNGQAPGGFGGQPPKKKNWLLFGGIGAGVIIVVLVVALVLQDLNKADTTPSTNPTSAARSTYPSNAPTDGDGIPVIPASLTGKTVPDKVGNFELVASGSPTFGRRTAMIFRDPSATPSVSISGSFSLSGSAGTVARDLNDVQRIGDFICGTSRGNGLLYCAARTSDGSIYFFSSPERSTIAILGELANGVIAGSK